MDQMIQESFTPALGQSDLKEGDVRLRVDQWYEGFRDMLAVCCTVLDESTHNNITPSFFRQLWWLQNEQNI